MDLILYVLTYISKCLNCFQVPHVATLHICLPCLDPALEIVQTLCIGIINAGAAGPAGAAAAIYTSDNVCILVALVVCSSKQMATVWVLLVVSLRTGFV